MAEDNASSTGFDFISTSVESYTRITKSKITSEGDWQYLSTEWFCNGTKISDPFSGGKDSGDKCPASEFGNVTRGSVLTPVVSLAQRRRASQGDVSASGSEASEEGLLPETDHSAGAEETLGNVVSHECKSVLAAVMKRLDDHEKQIQRCLQWADDR